MRRIKIIGLALLAVLAISGMAAATAWAGPYPNFKECVKMAMGKYTEKACKTTGARGKYELSGTPVSDELFGKGKGGGTIYYGSPVKKVECKKTNAATEISGPQTGWTVLVFHGCHGPGGKTEPCTEPGAPEEPGTIDFGLRYTELAPLGSGGAGDKLLTLLPPYFHNFTCGLVRFHVTGVPEAEITPVDTGTKAVTLTYAVDAKDEQDLGYLDIETYNEATAEESLTSGGLAATEVQKGGYVVYIET